LEKACRSRCRVLMRKGFWNQNFGRGAISDAIQGFPNFCGSSAPRGSPTVGSRILDAQGCSGKARRSRWLAFDAAAPRRPIAVNPPWRLEGTREAISARAAPWRVLRCAPALRVTAIARRGLLATKSFCCRNRPFGRFGQQNVLVAKGHRGGRGSRLAKRSGATGEAGVALRRARLDGSAAFGICAIVSESRQSEADEALWIPPCLATPALLAVQFFLILPGRLSLSRVACRSAARCDGWRTVR